ncbi:mitogen-activated protein kinase kinase kinase 14 [Nematolebias whitei]|uniref:mitogen-activated protein kinase kinase kinase 14 n=1 Tax=Nematolebias whitei TaxID=451745 RepID=UPI00189C340F|nr:mitogen-activated protein kinase kinase kinase 14 [Nematolebias whitei]
MAVRQRFFNSTEPFSGLPKAELKGSYPSCSSTEQDIEEEEEEGKDTKTCSLSVPEWGVFPLFTKLITRGTAEQVGESPVKTSTIIAQAECETQDSQEFSPSCFKRSFVPSPNCFTSSHSSEHNNVACPTTASVHEPSSRSVSHTQRRKNRRKQKSTGKKKQEKKKETQRQRHRTPSGVPEQESGSSVNLIQEESSLGGSDLSSSCCGSIESLVEQDRGHPFYSTSVYDTSPSCSPLNWPGPALCPLSTFQSYEQDTSSDSLSRLGDCSLALAGLRGSVSQGDRCYAGPFFKDVERDMSESEDELSCEDSGNNEGIIFYNENIQLMDSEYKEGREFILSTFIKQGSYGEVYGAQDLNTGYKYAVKKIALKRFSSEEVGAWSTLRSPRVVELFGVIRNGPYVLLLMEQKYGSLGQLIAQRGRLPEDLSLHYFSQVLTALEYLGKKHVAHLDIKADNVLLSEDGGDTFLCDFGHAEKLDNQGQSLGGSKDLKGTETHMAPEIVKGEPRGAKADVWSSCCMLLHMLNGCQPWTRYYTCILYLKIANDPPPLREIPPDCSPLTAEVLNAGFQKDPVKRSAVTQLKDKTDRALKEVGGLCSPVKGPYTEPLRVVTKLPDSSQRSDVDHNQDHLEPADKVIAAGLKTQKLPSGPQALLSEPAQQWSNKITTVPELELRKLERDFYLSSLSQLHSAEEQEQLLSCINSDPSNWGPREKKDSGRWSLSPGDDFSSGFFSYSSQPDVQTLGVDLLGHTPVPPPWCFEGVDVCIRNFSRRSIRIREKRRVAVGHIATGISDQISERVFTLETLQGRQVAHDEEVLESGLELHCAPAPDFCPRWKWRVRDGALEIRSPKTFLDKMLQIISKQAQRI